MRRFVLLALAASAVLPAAAAANRFQPFYSFQITFRGHGQYHQQQTGDGFSETVDSTFSWATPYANVLVPSKKSSPFQNNEFPSRRFGSEADGDWHIVSTNGDESCDHKGTLGEPKDAPKFFGNNGHVSIRRAAPHTHAAVVVNLEGISAFGTRTGAGDGSTACAPQDFWHDVVTSFAHVGLDTPGEQVLYATIALKRSDLRKKHFVRHVHAGEREKPDADCGSGDGSTCTQSYDWTGTVTFKKKKLR